MANTVAQHSVATFTSPVNGTTPIDANTVRGNDNTTRTAYNDHDADPGIHVQSSTLASRPVAGTAGRKWITEDSGVYTLWFDDGTNWHPVSSENVALTVLAGENLVKGDVVKVTGWNNGQDLPEVVKTTSTSDTAFAIITATVSSGSMGYATNTGIIQDVNTASYSFGATLYANGAGSFTATKPTSGHYQPCAYVLRSNVNNGVLYVEFSAPRIVERSDNTASTVVLRDASGDFSAGTITATAVNATTLDLTNLEVTNIKAKDGTQAIAIADSTGKLTISDGVLLSALTASQAVFTDASKNLVSNAITGTGNVVMSASPTLTGTVTAATLNATTLGGTLSTAAQTNVTSVGTLSSLTVSGDLTVDTSTLFVDATNNRVGIGTTSPSYELDIRVAASNALRVGSNSNSFGSLLSWDNATGEARLWSLGAYDLVLGTNGAERARLTSTGLGVGTSSPAYKLDVNTTGGSSATARLYGNDQANVRLRLENVGASGRTWELVGGSPGANNSSFALYDVTATATRLLVDASGNLGLGVTPSAWAPSAAGYSVMQVRNAAFYGISTNIARMSANAFVDGSGVNTYISNGYATRHDQVDGEFKWLTAPSGTAGNAISFTQAMTLDASGRLGIGVTSPGVVLDVTAATGQIRLISSTGTNHVFGSYENTGGVLRVGVDSSTGGVLSSGTAAYSGVIATTGAQALAFGTNATERARITSGGNLLLGGTNDYARLTVSAADAARIALVAGATRAVRIGADSTAAYVEGVDQTGVASYQPLYIGGSTLNLFVNGAEKMRVDATTTAGQTALLLWDVDNGTLERVTVGAADSGGVGYKVLRIPN